MEVVRREWRWEVVRGEGGEGETVCINKPLLFQLLSAAVTCNLKELTRHDNTETGGNPCRPHHVCQSRGPCPSLWYVLYQLPPSCLCTVDTPKVAEGSNDLVCGLVS